MSKAHANARERYALLAAAFEIPKFLQAKVKANAFYFILLNSVFLLFLFCLCHILYIIHYY